MFIKWIKRRELKSYIAQLEGVKKALYREPPDESVDEDVTLDSELNQLNDYKLKLERMETDHLLSKARRMGIEIPQKENWWWEDETFDGPMISEGVYEGKFYLTETGKAGVSRLIREEKRKSFEWWISKVIVPLITALISVLSLLVALVSVSSK